MATAGTPPAIRYTFMAHQLALSKLAANHFIGTIIDEETGTVLEYRHLFKNPAPKTVWKTSFSNKIGCLFQGIRELKGTNTCIFIKKSQVPTNNQPTLAEFAVIFAHKKGAKLYPPDSGWQCKLTANLTTTKLLINLTISTPGGIFLGINLVNFYLNTPLPDYKYMRLHLDIIPEEIVLAYNLHDIVKLNGWVYIKIKKGMYGLP